MIGRILIAISASVLLASNVHAGTTWYVNGDCGNDAWTGTSPVCAAPDGPKATIQAAINTSSDGDDLLVAPGTYVELVSFAGRAVSLRSADGPEDTILDGAGSGPVVTCQNGEGPDTVLEGFTITDGNAVQGGGMYNVGSSPTVRGCIFTGNHAEIGGAMRNQFGSHPLVEDCIFLDNTAEPAGAAMVNSEGHPVVINCLFQENTSTLGPGAVGNLDDTGGSPTFVNCRFILNSGGANGGGAVDGGSSTWINCIFSRNDSSGPLPGGGIAGANSPTVINCTFSDNLPYAIAAQVTTLEVVNSILWGSSVGSLYVEGGLTVSYSDVEGGAAGIGNIDADPLFAQPGTDNLRLTDDSPCLDAGDNAALPPDVLDLDGDGEADEPLPIDLDGNPRVIDDVVDMGAYEGEAEELPPADSVNDLDTGEFAFLIPDGVVFDPMTTAAALVLNTTGPDDASFILTQYDEALHPQAAGYSELSFILGAETTLLGGQFFMRLYIPFSAADLEGADPLHVNITYFDPAMGNWALAAAGNTVGSPGCYGPIGDRVVVEGSGDWGINFDLGDHGVVWEPDQQRGFAWANVDHEAQFGLGVPFCASDCHQTPDGFTGVLDLLDMLSALGGATGVAASDVNFDGTVNVLDLLAVLAGWGPCMGALDQGAQLASGGGGPSSVASGSAAASLPIVRSADVDGSGVVDREDLLMLRDAWGRCGIDCPADLDANGEVNVADMLGLLAGWG